ncbi:MAG: hypothetical protein QG652_54, partial [Pseudomonadota bacterium]|nr:hypothetical protein [Pseudomonadota bacterium]
MNYYPDSATPGKQRGGALIMLAVILILTVSLVVMSRMGRNGDELERQEDANTLLAKARDAIISIAVTNNVLPGMLVYPDRSDDDGIFDGGADCSGSNPVTNNLALTLGRLPYSEQTLAPGAAGGCTRLDISLDLNQSTYNLHYVVSPNLVQHNYNGLNNQINANVVSNNDGNPNVIDDNWLSVYDSNGNLLSDRVAFLIFYPGSALTTSTNHAQNRSGNTPGPGEFLDSATISINGAATLIDNANATDLRFVKAAPSAT